MTTDSESGGTSIRCIERGAIALTRVAPAAAMSAAWSEALVPCEKVTMYGREEAVCEEEEEVVSVELEEVSVEPEEVSVDDVPVSAELNADASVPVAPV